MSRTRWAESQEQEADRQEGLPGSCSAELYLWEVFQDSGTGFFRTQDSWKWVLMHVGGGGGERVGKITLKVEEEREP